MTHKDRMLAAARGAAPDVIPYAPRIDLWFHANKDRGTLPGEYKEAMSPDEVAISEGWALHKVILDYMGYGEGAIMDRALGVYRIPTQGFLTQLPEDVERRVERKGDEIHVAYVTPKGTVRGAFVFTQAMRRSGTSVPWIKEHVLKGSADYEALEYIFERMRVEPAYDGYIRWAESIGENGLPVVYGLTAGSPMHHVMKILLDATDFYYHHRDHERPLLRLADKIGIYYRKVFEVLAQGLGEVVLIGANFDDMLTYPPFFRDYIVPWLQEASDKLHQRGKLLLCHTDGENKGLMDLLLECRIDIAEALCPYPMTKVKISEYYERWCKQMTIFGGIPSNILLEEATTDDEFEAYLEDLFRAIVPGTRFILGVADTTPPDASFERLRKIHEWVQESGRLPLRGEPTADLRPAEDTIIEGTAPPAEQQRPLLDHTPGDEPYCDEIFNAILAGDQMRAFKLVGLSLENGADPAGLLKNCLLSPMDVIAQRFTDGTVFIPEVLLSARALNESMKLLEPRLHAGGDENDRIPLIVLGTVKGDLHDIGKNLVGIMFRSVGFEVIDLGINVDAKAFVEAVEKYEPSILAMSALLTTTMPEFKRVMDALVEADLRDKLKVMVGGAPVSAHFAETLGADGYAADAGAAAKMAKSLL